MAICRRGPDDLGSLMHFGTRRSDRPDADRDLAADRGICGNMARVGHTPLWVGGFGPPGLSAGGIDVTHDIPLNQIEPLKVQRLDEVKTSPCRGR